MFFFLVKLALISLINITGLKLRASTGHFSLAKYIQIKYWG